MNLSMEIPQHKYFAFMAILYVTMLLLTLVIENHTVLIFGQKILSGTLVLPLAYAISDIITEVYGYKQMRRLIWISFAVLYICAGIIFIVMNLPINPLSKENAAYDTVFAELPRQVFTYSIAALISIILNAYILSKWKILIRGKLFWIRSLCSTTIGEIIFILTWGFLGFSGKFPLKILLGLMLMSYVYKLAYNLVAVIPSAITVSFLKTAEKTDVYEYNTKFNPFLWET